MTLIERIQRWKYVRNAKALTPPEPDKLIVSGIPATIKPIRGIDPKAEAKLILRDGLYAELVMMTDSQDSSFWLEDRGDYWLVDMERRREVLIK